MTGLRRRRIPNRHCWPASTGSTASPPASSRSAATRAISASSLTETAAPADAGRGQNDDEQNNRSIASAPCACWARSLGLSAALGACTLDHGSRDRRAFPTITASVIRSRFRKPTARSSFSSGRPAAACPLRSAPTSWDWRGPGSAKAPARSSPTCRSTRRTRAGRGVDLPGNSGDAGGGRRAVKRHQAASLPSGRSRERLPTIRLSYPKISAVAGPCGLWPEDLGPLD